MKKPTAGNDASRGIRLPSIHEPERRASAVRGPLQFDMQSPL